MCCHSAEDYKEYSESEQTPEIQPMGGSHPKGTAGIIPIVISIGKLKGVKNHLEKCPDTREVECCNSQLFKGH